jgi:acyl-CoA synthetase (AMP-forming)/AMP-acid ligase II
VSPDQFALTTPDKPALIMGISGRTLSYRELVSRSRRLAHYFRQLGLRAGDSIALMVENRPEFFEICWAAQRSGLYYTPVNWHLQPAEVAHIVNDSGARLFIASEAVGQVVAAIAPLIPASVQQLVVGATTGGRARYEDVLAAQPDTPLEGETEGQAMLYSSGTTGYPKGIKRALSGELFGTDGVYDLYIRARYGMDDTSVYLCPAPAYHGAGIGYCMPAMRMGATVILMDRFDPVAVLQAIETHRVTHAQFVPTHFVRLLKLDDPERLGHDLSSLKVVMHAAAPCPPDVKDRMIQWLGPIIHEYYAATEGNGLTAIDSADWLAHRGSVGRPLLGKVRILDEEGRELPPGVEGLVFFSEGGDFEYHNDPAKTAQAKDKLGRSTVGDIGYVDAEGYLYLTDRKSHMIISGGVNIYPQEIENALALHPAIADVAVIGVPNAEFGEEVKAVVVPADPAQAGDQLAREIIEFTRERIAHYKCPRSVDFVTELPRLPTGKLAKRLLRDRYWPKA